MFHIVVIKMFTASMYIAKDVMEYYDPQGSYVVFPVRLIG